MRKTKRILAGLMTLCMLLGMFSVTAFAGDEGTTGGIESKLVFDLEIDPVNKTATDVKSGIKVNVQEATGDTTYSTLTHGTIASEQGVTPYLSSTNTVLAVGKAVGSVDRVTGTAAFSGIYTDKSAELTGDELTIEVWVKLKADKYATNGGNWGAHVFGIESLNTSGSGVKGQSFLVDLNGDDGNTEFKLRGAYDVDQPFVRNSEDKSNTTMGTKNVLNSFVDNWAQLVMTRKWDDGKYTGYCYFNAPDGLRFATTEFSSNAVSSRDDANGVLFVNMPWDGATQTSAHNREGHLDIGDVRVYKGIMTQQEAIEIYNRDASKYVNIASVSPENGSKLTAGSKTITVNYESAVAEANRSKLAIAEGSTTISDATTSWTNDGKTATLTFNAQMRKTYTLTYPLGDTTGTATYTTVGDIEETKVFDLEIDPVTKTAKDTVSNIGVHVQEAVQGTSAETQSTLEHKTLINENGEVVPYLVSKNTLFNNTESVSNHSTAVAGTAAFSGLYTDASDKLSGEELTVEAWIRVDNAKFKTYCGDWGAHVFGVESIKNGSGQDNRSTRLDLLNDDANQQFKFRGAFCFVGGGEAYAITTKKDESNTILGTKKAYNSFVTNWAQVVMTRKWDEKNKVYKGYIYINAPDGLRYTTVEMTSQYSSSGSTYTSHEEDAGVLFVNMPWNGATLTNQKNRNGNISIGDVRVYKGIMTQQEAINIYNRDASKYVDVSKTLTDDINLLNVACYDGDTKLDSIAGKANVSIKGSIYSNLDKDVKLFAALYKSDDTLSDVKLADVKSGATTVDVSFNNASADAGYVRLYVWDAASLEPYMVSKTIGVSGN